LIISQKYWIRYVFEKEIDIKVVLTAIRKMGGKIKKISEQDNGTSVSVIFNSIEKKIIFESEFKETHFYCFTANYQNENEQVYFLESLLNKDNLWNVETLKRCFGSGWNRVSDGYWYILASLLNKGYVTFNYDYCDKNLQFNNEYKNFLFTYINKNESNYLYWCAFKWLQKKNKGNNPEFGFLTTFRSSEMKTYLQVADVNQEFIVNILAQNLNYMFALNWNEYYILQLNPTEKMKQWDERENLEHLILENVNLLKKSTSEIEIEEGIKELKIAENIIEKDIIINTELKNFPNDYNFSIREIAYLWKYRLPSLKDIQHVHKYFENQLNKEENVNGRIIINKENVENFLEIKQIEVLQNKTDFWKKIRNETMDILIIKPNIKPELITIDINKNPFNKFFDDEAECMIGNHNGYKLAFNKKGKALELEKNIGIGTSVFYQNVYGAIIFAHYYDESLNTKDVRKILKSLNLSTSFVDNRLLNDSPLKWLISWFIPPHGEKVITS
jgi:hypothetical protein